MARTIYGDSYGGIAGTELATDSARDSRFFNTLNANQRAQQMADAEDQAAASQQLQWTQLMAGLAAQRRAQQEQDRAQALGRDPASLRLLELAMANKQFQQSLAAKSGEQSYGEATRMLGAGVPIDQLPSLYPSLSPNQLARLQAYRSGLSSQETAIEDYQKQLLPFMQAMILNAQKRKLDAEQGPGTTVENPGSEMPDLNESELEQAIAPYRKNMKLAELFSFDPERQAFDLIPQPRRFPVARPTAPSPLAASIPNTAPRIYHSEAEARADGLGTGDVALFADPGTGRIRRGRIK